DKACMKPRIVYATRGFHRGAARCRATLARSGFAVVGNHQSRRLPGAGRGGPFFSIRHGGTGQDRLEGADVRRAAYLLLAADATLEQLRPEVGAGAAAKRQHVRPGTGASQQLEKCALRE